MCTNSHGTSSCVAAIVSRPGSVAVTATFFAELSDVLDHIATFVNPVLLVGDVNIRLDRPADASAVQFKRLTANVRVGERVKTSDSGIWLQVISSKFELFCLVMMSMK